MTPSLTLRFKNKNIEAGVFLDDKIKADTALAADCLIEGTASILSVPACHAAMGKWLFIT
jgi:hypothetical protein